MRFKTERIKKEYEELPDHNRKLIGALITLDMYCATEFGKDVCLTHVFRTKQEHDELYAQTPADKRPKSSPHMFWQAADIRSTDFTDKQIEKILKLFNCFTYKSGQGKPSAIYHTISGNTFHLHLQLD
jgi:hypothetical protein